MSIYTREFKVSDYEAFTPIEPLGESEIHDMKFAQAIEDSGLAVTGTRNGEIVGCGGVHPIENEDEVGEMWLRLSADCQLFPMDTLRWLKDGLKIIEEVFPFKQLNATISCGFKKSIKMIEYLGFKRVELITTDEQKWAVYSKRVQA